MPPFPTTMIYQGNVAKATVWPQTHLFIGLPTVSAEGLRLTPKSLFFLKVFVFCLGLLDEQRRMASSEQQKTRVAKHVPDGLSVLKTTFLSKKTLNFRNVLFAT